MNAAEGQAEVDFPVGRYRPSHTITASSLVFLIPLTLWGTALIVDYPGPPGPLGWAELPGWWALCLLTGIFCRRLMLRRNGFMGFFVTLIPPIALGVATYVEIQPNTPPAIKDAVEYGLQGIGLLAMLLATVASCRIAAEWAKR